MCFIYKYSFYQLSNLWFTTTHAIPILVDQTQIHHELLGTGAIVPVCRRWSARRPTADQNVRWTLTVRKTRLVSIESVKILVLVYVVWMLNVVLEIMYLCVYVFLATLEIHSLSAIDLQVSILFIEGWIQKIGSWAQYYQDKYKRLYNLSNVLVVLSPGLVDFFSM